MTDNQLFIVSHDYKDDPCLCVDSEQQRFVKNSLLNTLSLLTLRSLMFQYTAYSISRRGLTCIHTLIYGCTDQVAIVIVSGNGFKKSYRIFRKGKQLFHAAEDVSEAHDVFEVFPHMEDELYKNGLSGRSQTCRTVC